MLQKVIQNIKILHRGHEEYSSDPYSNNLKKATYGKFVGRSKQTLGTSNASTRCSSTLDFLFGKESLTKKTSKNFETKINPVSKFDYYIKSNRNIRFAGISASFLLLTISALTIYPIIKENHSAEAATPVAADTVLTFTSSLSSANLNLVVKDSNGTFASSSDSESSKFSITTNNYTGYTLSITGPENNNLTNEDTNKVFTSIDSNIDAYTFTNGSGELYNGKYGYLPSKYNSAVNNYFRPAPTEDATTLDETNTASAKKSGAESDEVNCDNYDCSEYSIALGARADYSTPNGVYSNTFILTLVANPVAYQVNYLDNSGDSTVSGLPTSEGGNTKLTSVTLSDAIPTRTGYTFKSWCLGNEDTNDDDTDTTNDTVTESGTVCNGTEYNAGSTLDFINQTIKTSIANLYAVWTINTYSLTINFAGSGVASVKVCTIAGDCSGDNLIGTVTTSGGSIAGLTYLSTYYLYPTFSSNYEFVSWANSGSYGTLSCTTTNTCTTETNPSFTIGAGNGNVAVTGKSTCQTTITGTMQDFNPCSTIADKSTGSLTDSRDNQVYTVFKYGNLLWMSRNLAIGCNGSGTTYGDTVSSKSLTSSNSNVSSNWSTPTASLTAGNSYDEARMTCSTTYGAWYNYAAASAGTITGSSDSTEASSSICPKNWRLFTSAERTTTTDFKNSFSPVPGGYYSDGRLNTTGYGSWWSSTASYATLRDYLYYDGRSLDTASNGDRYFGFYVRCVRAAS